MADEAQGNGQPHPLAVKARELQETVERLQEMAREALAQGLNPEVAEDIHRSIARFRREIDQLFE